MYYKSSSRFRKTDALFRLMLLSERPDHCEWCMRVKPLDLAHVLPKGVYIKLRYDPANILLLCRYCHRKWHDSLVDAMTFLAKYKGINYMDNLRIKDRMISRTPDLKMIAMCFKKELITLTRGKT